MAAYAIENLCTDAVDQLESHTAVPWHLAADRSIRIRQVPSPFSTISMRRFRARPCCVSFDATGCSSPNPLAFSELGFTPCDWKYDTASEARLSESSVLSLMPT